MYALIQKSDNTILKTAEEFTSLSNQKPFYWKKCSSDVNTSWTFNGKDFIRPVEQLVPTTVELVVTPWQLRQALNELNLRSQIDTFIKTTTNQDIKDGWEYATEWREFNPLVRSICEGLGITETQIHTIFLVAKQK